jgi:hypothetical protein
VIEVTLGQLTVFCEYVDDGIVFDTYSKVSGELVLNVGKIRSQWGGEREGNLLRSGGGSCMHIIL